MAAIQHILEHHQDAESARIYIHDFWYRPHYHFVLNFLEVKEKVKSAGVFTLKEDINVVKLEADWEKYSKVPE